MQVSASSRRRYEFPGAAFTPTGRLGVTDVEAAQLVAHRMNVVRDAERFPESSVRAGDLVAAGLIEDVFRLLISVYREQRAPQLFAEARDDLTATIGSDATEVVLGGYVGDFPPPSVLQGDQLAAQWLDEASAGEPHRSIALEELLLLNLSNTNPALVRIRDVFDDRPLAAATPYPALIDRLAAYLDDLPGPGEGGDSLIGLLRAPAQASPTSLQGQLDYIRQNWAGLLGDRFATLLDRLLRSLDILEEEQRMRGIGGGPPPIIDAGALGGPGEYERFSQDRSWMPRVVLMAKSTYVWLDQLSKEYGLPITRLDQVPDAELDRLATAGFTGLWLIGLWERSVASRTIKHLRGDPDAVASAYSLYDYVIAADLGGDEALGDLKGRAWDRGIRLASDMVPNHVGIDGRWVIQHPDWFLSLPDPPYPGYHFTGQDLSSEDGVTVQIEDHYWDGTDAAVVFKRYDHGSGDTRYIYHGNDGTAMPWNDTAQLDYLNPDTREAVIQTIFHVARQFPIIRFDAAMTLAKKHIQRLWFPQPGSGGAIPSRAQYGMTAEEFDAAMPAEFWREVVDRVADEVPDTLLLAEAFWLMEGYFVRTLGMHRVYNSAFMHMFAQEDNGGYRKLMRNVLEFDPEILKRFVNFMNNPDEETAVAQFGKDDKYFGVSTVMATMPGLPMFGHGQLEGYAEKYGMEFRRARWDEQPDRWLMDRHAREIYPLLHRRAEFAGVEHFLLYDVVDLEGHVNEDVFAYSNRVGDVASLVIYNNRFATAVGSIHTSVGFAVKDGEDKRIEQRSLAQGLGLRAGPGDLLRFRDHVSGLEYLRRSADVADAGMAIRLEAFKYHVFLDIQELRDAPADWHHLCDHLGGEGVQSLEAAMDDLRFGPVRAAFAAAVAAPPEDRAAGVDVLRQHTVDVAPELLTAATDDADVAPDLPAAATDDAVAAIEDWPTAATVAEWTTGVPVRLRRVLAPASPEPAGVATYLQGLTVSAAVAGDRADRMFTDLDLAPTLAELLPDDARPLATWAAIALRHGDWASAGPRLSEEEVVAAALADLAADPAVPELLGVHDTEEGIWLVGEAYTAMVAALYWSGLRTAPSQAARRRVADRSAALLAAAADAGYRWDRLTEV